jgi:hypothetical protein
LDDGVDGIFDEIKKCTQAFFKETNAGADWYGPAPFALDSNPFSVLSLSRR